MCTDRGTDTGKHTIRKMHVGRNGLMIQSSSNRLMTRWSANTKQKVAAVWYSGHHDTDSGHDVRLSRRSGTVVTMTQTAGKM